MSTPLGLQNACSLTTQADALTAAPALPAAPALRAAPVAHCPEHSLLHALLALLAVLNADKVFVVYTDEYRSIVDALYTANLSLVLWRMNSTSCSAEVVTHLSAFSTTAIVLTNQTYATALLNQTHTRQYPAYLWTWLVPTATPPASWQPAMRFGDRVVLVDYSEHAQLGDHAGNTTAPQVVYGLWKLSMETGRIAKMGRWSNVTGLEADIRNAWKFTRFKDKHFNIATIHWPIFHMKSERGNRTVWSGMVIELLKAIAKSSNFTYTLHESVDGQWGAPAEDGGWTGMVGMVQRQEVDFAVAKFTITAVRDTVIDFTTPYWHEPAVIVMRKPTHEQIFTYFGPFRYEVWIALICVIPVGGLVLASTVKMDHVIKEKPYNKPFHKTWYMTTWTTFGSMVQQGSEWLPSSQASRVIIGFWWFFSIACAATYTGNLIAALAVPKTTLPVRTLSELARQGEYTCGLVENSALHSLFRYSSFDVYRTLWRKHIRKKSNNVKNHMQGLQKVKSDRKYIYLGELGGVAPIIYKDCDYAMGEEEFFPSSFGLVFPENSPLIPIFNEQITDLVETGVMERWRREYYPRDECRSVSTAPSAQPASLRDSQGAFILLAGCTLLATLLLVGELALAHVSKHPIKLFLYNRNHHRQSAYL